MIIGEQSCSYYCTDVKKEKHDKREAILRAVTSDDFKVYRSDVVAGRADDISADIKNRMIENAEGIPYELMFGNNGETAFFGSLSESVRELTGISKSLFTWDFYQKMIEEIRLAGDDETKISYDQLRERIIAGEITSYKAEVHIITPSGDRKWIKDCAVAVTDRNSGVVTGLAGIFYDISWQKEIIQQLNLASERATESDRLKTAFLNNLSHEIRTPLNAIVGFSSLLVEPGRYPGARMEYMDIITQSSDHLLEIVDDIVEISKIEAHIVRLSKKEVNLTQMMQRLFERFNKTADEKQIMFLCNQPPHNKDICLFTDGYKLFQTLNNLISNAIKFTRTGKVEFGFSIKNGKIEFYVLDTGLGISSDYQDNIYKPFFQVESSSTKRYEGTGLGLSIAKAYVELLGGEIWFNSESGKGSVFCFSIPDTRIYC